MMKPTKKVKTWNVHTWKSNLSVIGAMAILLLAGLLLIGLSGRTLISGIQAKSLTCIRLEPSQHNCVLQTKLLGIVPLQTRPITNLRWAFVDAEQVASTSSTSNGQSSTEYVTRYSVVLSTIPENIRLDAVGSTDFKQKDALVEQINGYLDDPEVKSLEVQGDSLGWAGALSYLIPIGMGVGCLIPPIVTFVIIVQMGVEWLAGSRLFQRFSRAKKGGSRSTRSVKKRKRKAEDKM